MSIELDWQIYDDDTPLPEMPPITTPKPRRRRWLLAFVTAPLLVAISLAAGLAVLYHVRLDQVAQKVYPLARLEAQAIAENDAALFLALQDSEDDAWRSMQAKGFGRLERVGLPEFGWRATDSEPQPGNVTLEPGGARVDMLHCLSVTHPLPDGPTTIVLQVPHFYRETPSGWMRAMPGPEYWGEQRTQSGKRFAMLYWQCDADWLKPLIPYMDKVLERACTHLPCPSQPLYVVFDHDIESLERLTDPAQLDINGTLHLPSPHLLGMPTDKCSRDELYRAIAIKVIEALLDKASDQQLDTSHPAWQTILHWELAQAGLAASPVTQVTAQNEDTSFWKIWRPLSAISLQPRTAQAADAQPDSLLPLALSFIEEQYGAGAVARLTPAASQPTLGQAIREGLGINPAMLESAWLSFARGQACLATHDASPLLPASELVLEYAPERERSGIWRARVGAAGQAHFSRVSASGSSPAWSADGKELAFVSATGSDEPSVQVQVMDSHSHKTTTAIDDLQGANLGWLQDGRLWVWESNAMHLVDDHAHSTFEIAGTQPRWSPDGAYVAYVAPGLDGEPAINVFDAAGRSERAIASGIEPVWSPDGTRLAFWSGVSSHSDRVPMAAKIQIADMTSGAVQTLAQGDNLLHNSLHEGIEVGDMAWSPDGMSLAVTMGLPGSSPTLLVLETDSGATSAEASSYRNAPDSGDEWLSLASHQAWSPDSRHIVAWITPANAWFDESRRVMILDVQTGEQLELPGAGAVSWHPTGRWLAVPQSPNGILLVTPDLAGMHWLDTPQCSSVAWKPVQ
jgi:WD40-like Beta Propeller Repeat